MSADPPGVDELDPARFAGEELDKQFDGTVLPTVEFAPGDDPQVTPPASPDGHHQTHSVPVDLN